MIVDKSALLTIIIDLLEHIIISIICLFCSVSDADRRIQQIMDRVMSRASAVLSMIVICICCNIMYLLYVLLPQQ